jgi:hypothetical protein
MADKSLKKIIEIEMPNWRFERAASTTGLAACFCDPQT